MQQAGGSSKDHHGCWRLSVVNVRVSVKHWMQQQQIDSARCCLCPS